jgi:membrane protein
VEQAFPGLIGTGSNQININDIVAAKAGTGLLGLIGLLYAGLGWVDALRDGLRRVFGTLDEPLPVLKKKLVDILVLLMLGGAVLASIVVSSLATSATGYVLGLVGLEGQTLAVVLLKVLAVALALVLDTLMFAILFTRLSGAHLSWRQVRSGAVVAAVGFEVLKLLGTFLIARTTDNPLYATFGVVVGLLVWINLVSKLLVYAAAWTATDPYSLVPAAADNESVPVDVAGVAAGSSRRTRTVRGVLVGAVLGAGLAGALTRRGWRD